MEIASKYNPAEVEGKWYQYWLDNGFFKSKPDGREPYTIVIPPPNVTGVLHMGHMLNNTIAAGYLNAELEVCKMIQNVNSIITGGLQLDLDFL